VCNTWLLENMPVFFNDLLTSFLVIWPVVCDNLNNRFWVNLINNFLDMPVYKSCMTPKYNNSQYMLMQ
jgi:hypothetical protein